MKATRSYFIAIGSLVILSGSIFGVTQQDVRVALDDMKNDITKLYEAAKSSNWSQALWHAEQSAAGRKMVVEALLEPIAADYGTPEAGHRLEVDRRIVDFINKAQAVFARFADTLKRLASQDIIEYKAYQMSQRVEKMKESLNEFISNIDIKKIAGLVQQYKLRDIFSPEFIEHMKSIKSAFIERAQNAQQAITKGVEQLMAKFEDLKKQGKLQEQRWWEVLETTD
jgi:hypothetical protein